MHASRLVLCAALGVLSCARAPQRPPATTGAATSPYFCLRYDGPLEEGDPQTRTMCAAALAECQTLLDQLRPAHPDGPFQACAPAARAFCYDSTWDGQRHETCASTLADCEQGRATEEAHNRKDPVITACEARP